MATKKKVGLGKMIGAGVGIAALSVAGYLLFGPEGKKNRKVIKGWTVKMKGDIIERLEDVKEVTQPIYDKVVDEVSKTYTKAKGLDEADVQAFAVELKKQWKAIAGPAKKSASKAKKTTKKAAKK